jgi:hypothetical protein
MTNIRTDLIMRVCIITAVFSLLSYVLVSRNEAVQDIPVFFILFGIVLLISILYDVERFHAMTKPDTESKT